VKAEHHDCKSWLNFSRSVASITWAEHCNNYPSNTHTGRLTSPLRLHPDLLPLPLKGVWWHGLIILFLYLKNVVWTEMGSRLCAWTGLVGQCIIELGLWVFGSSWIVN